MKKRIIAIATVLMMAAAPAMAQIFIDDDDLNNRAGTDDYTSRFKIVFGTVNNEEEEEETTIETFAFFNDGSLIVNGEGRLDVIDVLGRIVYSAELTDTQNTVSLPQNAKGVCMLRLTNGDNVKVQKMFVR